MTCGGKLPVVGFLMIDPTKNKCKFSAGADVNFDIALQRCVTETFQGRKLDLSYTLAMNELFDMESQGSPYRRLKTGRRDCEYLRQVVSGTGVLPLGMIINAAKYNPDHMSVFEDTVISNRQALEHMINIAKNNEYDVYVKDYSITGFPTFRVFISSYSDVNFSVKKTIEKIILRGKINQQISSSSIDLLELGQLLRKLNRITLSEAEHQFSHISGVFYSNSEFNYDTRDIEISLLIHLGEFGEAASQHTHYFRNNRDYKYIQMYLRSLNDGSENITMEYLAKIDHKFALECIMRFIKKVKDITNYLQCRDCNECPKKELCLYKEQQRISDIVLPLANSYKVSLSDYNQMFMDINFT